MTKKSRIRLRTFIGLVGLLFLSACASQGEVKPQSHQQSGLSPAHQLIHDDLTVRSDQFHRELTRKGLIIKNGELADYIREIGGRVVPADIREQSNIRFYLLRNPTANAMALPDGSIYINVGLVALLENEEQLAMILGHEAAHVIFRHSIEKAISESRSKVAANISDIALVGLGLPRVSYLAAGLGLMSFSRDQETEADLMGIEYVEASGYNPAQGAKAFERMMSLPFSAGGKGSIYSSHPGNTERVKNLSKKVALGSLPDTATPASTTYTQLRRLSLTRSVKMHLQSHHYQLAIDLVERAEGAYGAAAIIQYYRGETYRLMAEYPLEAADEEALLNGKRKPSEQLVNQYLESVDGNRQQAFESFHAALELDPELHKAHKGLGLNAKAVGDHETARHHLETYQVQSSSSREQRYIARMLNEMEKN